MIQDFNEIGINKFKILLECSNTKLIFPLFKYNNIHYLNNKLVSLYIYDVHDQIYYSFNIESKDLKLSNDEIVFNQIKPLNTFIEKSPYFYKYWNDINDIAISLWMVGIHYEPISDTCTIPNIDNLFQSPGLIYPWIKFIESVQNFIKLNSHLFKHFKVSLYEKIWTNIYRIDKAGINSNNKIIHTHYSTLTKTGRPSSTFLGMNMLALSKTEDRIHIQPRKGQCLFEFDWESCHIRLIGNLINYIFPENENVHMYFSKIYLNKEDITDTEYRQCKSLTFQYLYGESKLCEHNFFNEVNEFKFKLYKQFKENSYILSPITKRKITNIDDVNPSKLLNYLVQAYETEIGLIRIKELCDYIDNFKNNYLVLWTYDSFLFDLPLTDDIKTILKTIKTILQKDNMQVHIKYGLKNYSDMQLLTLN